MRAGARPAASAGARKKFAANGGRGPPPGKARQGGRRLFIPDDSSHRIEKMGRWTMNRYALLLTIFLMLAVSAFAQDVINQTDNGTGTVTGNGYSSTVLAWSFSSQDPNVTSNPTTFTFSASGNSIPDGGATATLLGIALSGAALLKRKLTA